MTREQPEREIKGCQLGFIAGVPVHEQNANNTVYIAFKRSLGNFYESIMTSNTTLTYVMLKHLLRFNQQYQNMQLVFKHFC